MAEQASSVKQTSRGGSHGLEPAISGNAVEGEFGGPETAWRVEVAHSQTPREPTETRHRERTRPEHAVGMSPAATAPVAGSPSSVLGAQGLDGTRLRAPALCLECEYVIVQLGSCLALQLRASILQPPGGFETQLRDL